MINEDLFSRTISQMLLCTVFEGCFYTARRRTNMKGLECSLFEFAYALQIRMRAHIEAMSYNHCVFAKSSFRFMKMKIISIDFLTKNFRLTKQKKKGSEIQNFNKFQLCSICLTTYDECTRHKHLKLSLN